MKKIVIILPTLSQPRFHKRIEALRKSTIPVEIYAFDRGLFNENAIKGVTIKKIGKIENRNYLSRFIPYYLMIKNIFLKERKKETLFYLFNIDLGVLGYLFLKRQKYIYEISDFSYMHYSDLRQKIFFRLDLKVINKSALTVLTSEKFRTFLIKKRESLNEKIVVIPNKLIEKVLDFPRQTNSNKGKDNFSFGFVGLFRHPNTILRFAKVVGEHFPQHTFSFYGDGGLKKEISSLVQSYKNIYLYGAYKNPDDLHKIYSTIDLNVVCYDTSVKNSLMAEPNKLYESIYFCTPIIVSEGTFLSEKVKDLKIGWSTDASSDDLIIDFINTLSRKKIEEIKTSCMNIDKFTLIHSDSALLDRIQAINLNKNGY